MGGLFLTLLLACQPPVGRVAEPPEDLPPTAVLGTWRELADDDVAPRALADGQGTLELVEGPLEPPAAGTSTRFRLRVTVGPLGIAPGGSIQVVVPAFWGWSPPQLDHPDAPGFVTVSGIEGVEVDVLPPSVVRLRALRPLAAGEAVVVGYGEGPAGARVDRFAERAPAFWVGVDGDGDGVRALLPEPVVVEVVAGPAVGLVATLPSTARPGETVTLRVAALDAAGNAAAWTLPAVRLQSDGLELPTFLRIPEDGRARLDVVVAEPGIYRVTVSTPEGSTTSNPMLVHEQVVKQAWADLQVHSAASDGSGGLDAVYAYARDTAGLDAVAITDHDHFGMRFLDRDPAAWVAQVDAASRWYAPGRFVTFPAYEWTSWLYGHRHVLYVGPPGPVFGSLDPATRTPDGLWAALADRDVITIPHHVAGGPVAIDWRYRAPRRVEPVVEVCSVHGVSEAEDAPSRIYGYRPGTSARDALLGGHRLGFLCSTDGHDGHPGLSQLAGGQGGLAALLTEDLTREGLARALRERRVYGTNGPRIVLRTLTAGLPMGSVVATPPDPLPVEVRVIGTAPIARVDVVRGADVVARVAGDGEVGHFRFDLPEPRAGEFVYVRVLQRDGGLAWSSPVWMGADAAPMAE